MGVVGLSASFFLVRAAFEGDAGGPLNAVVAIASGIAGIVGVFSGPGYLSKGTRYKSQLKTSSHYKALSLQNLNVTPHIQLNQFSNTPVFGVTASLTF
jgi:hypothetical protein